MIYIYILLGIITIGNIIAFFSYKKAKGELTLQEKTLQKKEKTLQEKINDVNKILNFEIREGYIDKKFTKTIDNTTIKVRVFVTEIDRYTNGKSKIALKDINILSGTMNKNDILKELQYLFKDIEDTNSIEWLESVNEIQKIRREKLKRVLDGQ